MGGDDLRMRPGSKGGQGGPETEANPVTEVASSEAVGGKLVASLLRQKGLCPRGGAGEAEAAL